MKQTIATVILLFSLSGVYAQGIKVIYNEQLKNATIKVKTSSNIGVSVTSSSSLDHKQGKSMILIQYKNQSLYEPFITQSEAALNQSIDPKFRTPEIFSVIHKNREKNQITTQETLLGEKYLITGSLTDFGWKLLNEEKKIDIYTCKKAVDTSGNITAWYCPDIPSKDGPGIYQGLPGLILQIELKEGKITATDIDTEYTPTKRVIPPANGKKINRKDFEELKKEKMEAEGIQENGTIIKIQ